MKSDYYDIPDSDKCSKRRPWMRRRKIRHATEGEAVDEASRLYAEGRVASAYLCEFCGGWHVGKQKGWMKKMIYFANSTK